MNDKKIGYEHEIIVNTYLEPIFLLSVNEDKSFSFLVINKAYENLINKASEEIRGEKLESVSFLNIFKPQNKELKKCIDTQLTVSYKEEIITKESSALYEISLTPIIENNKTVKILGICFKCEKQKGYNLFDIFNTMNQYVFIMSKDYKFIFLNNKAKKDFGNLVGKTCFKVLNIEFPCLQCPIKRLKITNTTKSMKYEINFLGKNLKGIALEFQESDGTYSVLQILEDVSMKIQYEKDLKYMSNHDILTGLYNRNFIEEAMKRLDSKRQLPISVIIADINGLKLINDSLGHDKGDEYIKNAAKLIKDCCSQEDIVSRWSGDEFVVLLPKTEEEAVSIIVKRIKKKCAEIIVDSVPLSIAFGYATKNSCSDQSLFILLKEAEDYMYKNKLTKRKSIRGEMLLTLTKTLEAKSDETILHSMRMTNLSFMLGEKLKLSSHELDKLSILASLHDIGKISISEGILNKKDALNEEEWKIIKEHPKIGYNILSSIKEFAFVAEEVYSHHERWDGRGYPEGLKGKEIPFLARMISIIDTYDVLVNGRIYKDAISWQEALGEIERCSGTNFDPNIAKEFIMLVNELEGF